ncbi:protein NDR1-like [Papaver somniferum]|uniref:protein NDR1-like n=1 Tax=Papaver somniferum TaxID=3469 RepID=UPI000E70201D|nr:protein NDR1-like [Papaver somniferum]
MSKRGCLCCGIGVIVVVGLFVLFSWLITAQIHSPKCSIEKFYVPALDKAYSSNKNAATSNTTISFDLRFKNQNGVGSGVYYDALNISLYYYEKSNSGGDLKRLPIGNVSIPGFYQAKVDHRLETVQTFGVPWEEARVALSNRSTTMFRLDLASSIRLKIPIRYVMTTDREKLNLGVNVSVNDQGMKTVPGSLRLTSASSHINPCSILVLVLSVLCLIR